MISTLMTAALALGAAAVADLAFADVTYSANVRPILDAHCVECHHQGGRSPDLSAFPFTARDGADQAAIVARILTLTEAAGGRPALMPPGARPKLSAGNLDVIRAWRDQGLAP